MCAQRTNEIPVLEVEAIELIARLLCIHYVFIDNEGRALGVVCDSLADLATLISFATFKEGVAF